MYKVDIEKQKELSSLFPFCFKINNYDDNCSDKKKCEEEYDLFFISVFNKWLNDEECDKYTMCYSHYLENKDNMYLLNENKFIKFYDCLFSMEIYSLIIENDSKCIFYGFDTLEEFKKNILLSIREKKFMNLCVPKFKMIICGGFDLTHRVFIKKNNHFDCIIDFIIKNNIYLI